MKIVETIIMYRGNKLFQAYVITYSKIKTKLLILQKQLQYYSKKLNKKWQEYIETGDKQKAEEYRKCFERYLKIASEESNIYDILEFMETYNIKAIIFYNLQYTFIL